MKYRLFSFAAVFCFLASNAFGQLTAEKPKKWTRSHMTSTLGGHVDRYKNMDLEFLQGRINDDQYGGSDLSNYRKNDNIYNTSGGMWNVNLQFTKATDPNEPRHYEQLEFGMSLHFGREVMIDYDMEDPYGFCSTNSLNYCASTITFCDMQNELNVSGIYKSGVHINKRFNMYMGMGASLGTTFESAMWIFQTQYSTSNQYFGDMTGDESYDMSEIVTGRLFVPFGVEIIFLKRCKFISEFRYGVGFATSAGHGTFANTNSSMSFGFGWTI